MNRSSAPRLRSVSTSSRLSSISMDSEPMTLNDEFSLKELTEQQEDFAAEVAAQMNAGH